MNNRREFLRQAATGAVVLGAQQKLAFSRAPAVPAGAKVIVARDSDLHDAFREPIPERVQTLLDRAIAAYTGREPPARAWKQILGNARVIGLKTNGLGGKGISTHAVLVQAVAERLQQAGIKPGDIIVWDRNARDLRACGLDISTDPSRMRCFGSDVAGFEDHEETFGTARVRLSKILGQCDLVIGMPILKDHSMSGVTFAMKNMFGVVERPQDLHPGGCNPGIADLNCIPAIRNKVRFTIGDALSSVYDGGPGFRPERLWYPNALIVGEDRVAVDQVAWQMLERQRKQAGLGSFEDAGRPPRYIATAADPSHALGIGDPARIHVVNL